MKKKYPYTRRVQGYLARGQRPAASATGRVPLFNCHGYTLPEFISHNVFIDQFQKVNSPPEPST